MSKALLSFLKSRWTATEPSRGYARPKHARMIDAVVERFLKEEILFIFRGSHAVIVEKDGKKRVFIYENTGDLIMDIPAKEGDLRDVLVFSEHFRDQVPEPNQAEI